jgi:multidrug efflux pump subunit AcrB
VSAVESIDLVTAAANNGTTSRAYLPLAALGEFELAPELSSIPHHDGIRVNTVQGFIQAGVLPSKVLATLLERLEARGFEMPVGYRWEIGGESAERDDAVSNLMASVSVLLVVMGATLVLTFGSFRMAALLAVVAGLSVGLGLAALVVTGYPFGFMAIVGTMGLVGVAVNDSIVVTAAIRANPSARQGDPDAIRDVVVKATRHVLATTTTTIAGFVPLLAAGGAFWPPLAVAIAGGVIGSTLLALVLVPSAYVILMCPRRPSRASVADAEANSSRSAEVARARVATASAA